MVKSKVIKELANNEITLEIALNRLLIIAADIENEELSEWAEKELNGYSSDDTIPGYRIIKNTRFVYSGINGRFQVKNAPLPIIAAMGLDPETFYINCHEGISTIQGFVKAENGKEYGKDLTYLADSVYKISGIQCYSINQIISRNSYEDILNIVKTTLLKIFIKLDKSFGNLDDLDIDISDKTPEEIEKVNTIINQFIYTDNRITIGDKNKISDSRITGKGANCDEEE